MTEEVKSSLLNNLHLLEQSKKTLSNLRHNANETTFYFDDRRLTFIPEMEGIIANFISDMQKAYDNQINSIIRRLAAEMAD